MAFRSVLVAPILILVYLGFSFKSVSAETRAPQDCDPFDKKNGFCPCEGVDPKRPPTPVPPWPPEPEPEPEPEPPSEPRGPQPLPTMEPTPTSEPIDCEGINPEPGCYYHGYPIPVYRPCLPAVPAKACEPSGPLNLPPGVGMECFYDWESEECKIHRPEDADDVFWQTHCPQQFPGCPGGSVDFQVIKSCSGCWKWADSYNYKIECNPTSREEIKISFQCTYKEYENRGTDPQDGFVILDKTCFNANPSECAGSCKVLHKSAENGCRAEILQDVHCGPPNPNEDDEW